MKIIRLYFYRYGLDDDGYYTRQITYCEDSAESIIAQVGIVEGNPKFKEWDVKTLSIIDDAKLKHKLKEFIDG